VLAGRGGVGAVVGIGGAVLPLETDVLVNRQMAEAGVDSSGDGEGNDHACVLRQYRGKGRAHVRQLTEGVQLGRDVLDTAETLRDGVCCASSGFLSAIGFPISLHPQSLMLSSELSSPHDFTYQPAPPSVHPRVSSDAIT